MLCSSKGDHCLLTATLPKGSVADVADVDDDAVNGKIALELFGFLCELILFMLLPLLMDVVMFLPLLLLVLAI